MSTTQNNKIIAEFMGMTQGKPNESRWKNNWFEKLTVDGNQFESGRRHEYLLFNSDWNWLMEVVEKIESLESFFGSSSNYRIKIDGNLCRVQSNEISNWEQDIYGTGETKMQAVYNACVEFIKWYNLNK